MSGEEQTQVEWQQKGQGEGEEGKEEETGGVGGGFGVWVRNLPLCQPQLDIKWWQCDRNYLLTLPLKLCGLRFGDSRSEKELANIWGK